MTPRGFKVTVNRYAAIIKWVSLTPVSYTHLTLPTIYSV